MAPRDTNEAPGFVVGPAGPTSDRQPVTGRAAPRIAPDCGDPHPRSPLPPPRDAGCLKLEGIHESPVNIAVFYKPEKEPVLGQNTMPETGEYSVVCAVQNMWLMSRALNVGLGWVSILDPQAVKKILNAPAPNKLVAYLCIGYVGEFFSTPELERLQWKARKPLEAAIHRDSYPDDNAANFES